MKWLSLPLKDVAPAQTADVRFAPNENVWQLTLDQIESHTGNIVNKRYALVSDAGSSTYAFDNGNVLYSKLRPYLNKVLCPTETGIATTELVPLRPRNDLIDRQYLTYYLRSNHFLGFANVAVAGVKMPRIIMAKFWKHQIPLPPLSEQHRIVEILDQADALRKKRAEADEKASRILQILFYSMFGDPTTNSKGWQIKPLSAFGASARYGLGQPPRTSGGGLALIRATNISQGTICKRNMIYVDPQDVPIGRNAFLKKEEVIVVRSGAYTGDVAQVTEEWEGCVAGYDMVITPGDHLTGEFLEAYLLTPFIQRGYFFNLKARAGQPHLNTTQLAATPILDIPLELQKQFSKAVKVVRDNRKNATESKARLERMFSSLMHQAFSGELTAKWRDAHMNELLAEMEEQARSLENPSDQNSYKKPLTEKRHYGYDMYNKAALAAYIAERCHSDEHPMGRVKLAKLFYLTQKKAELQLTKVYAKRAAGPLDDQIHKFLSLAKKQGWVELGRTQGELKPVKPGKNLSKAYSQVTKLLGEAKDAIDSMLDEMKGWKYSTLERWATVLEAALGLSDAGKEVSVGNLKSAILSEKEWARKLDRSEFADEHIGSTLAGLKRHGFLR